MSISPESHSAPADDEPAALTPEQTAALIAQTRAHTRRSLDPSTSGFLWAWGIAWLLGYSTLWTMYSGHLPAAIPRWVPGVVFTVLMVAAMAYTAIHTARHSRGVRGRSQWIGAGYGFTWLLGFAALPAIGVALQKLGLPESASNMYWSLAPAALVGIMYMTGALIYPELTWFITGALIVVSVVAATFAGPVGCLVVMALGGGGTMLAGAAVITVLGRARERKAHP